MILETNITVGNNVTLGFDKVRVTTTGLGFIHLFIPQPKGNTLELELKRSELIEFLLRTQPELVMELRVSAFGGKKTE